MADPLYIHVNDAAEGAALARAIGRYGLSAGLVRSDTRWQVEIRSPQEDPRAFVADVGVALAAWNGGDDRGSGQSSPSARQRRQLGHKAIRLHGGRST